MRVQKRSSRNQSLVPGTLLLGLLCSSSIGQTTSVRIPARTPLSIQLLQHVPMKAGESLEGRLLYPVYVDNRIAIPAGATLRGTVIQLDSDRSRRIHARLRGDFTPFHIPVVRFDELVLPGGERESMVSDSAKDGAPILRLSPAPGQKKGSVVSRQIAAEKQRVKDAVAQITAPGRGDRLVQFIYTQLPYHPERIETGTAWTVDLATASGSQARSTLAPRPVTRQIRLARPPQPNGDCAPICKRQSAPPTGNPGILSRRWSRSRCSMPSTQWLFPRDLCSWGRSHRPKPLARSGGRESSVFGFGS